MKKKSAFTLIELIVVISIIALISTVTFISLSGSKQKERDAKKISDVLQLQTALENYKRAEGVYPSTITLGQPLVGSTTGVTFLSKVPVAPAGETCAVSQYSYSYSTTTKEYSLSFCINNDLEDYTAGVYYATPRGIEKAPPACGDPDYVLTGIDGTTYPTVLIGTQCWMAKNLDYLPVVHSNSQFATQSSGSLPGYGVYGYDGSDVATAKSQPNYSLYGVYYNWFAVNQVTICPTGWHVPSNSEWQVLRDFLGGSSVAGGKMKEIGTTTWLSPNNGATNESNFTGLPGGWRDTTGAFAYSLEYAFLWTSSSSGSDAYRYGLYRLNTELNPGTTSKQRGLSVRCIKN